MIDAQAKEPNTVGRGSRRRTVPSGGRSSYGSLGAIAMVRYVPSSSLGGSHDDLRTQIQELTAEVKALRQEQSMPAFVLTRYRNSIGYVSGRSIM